MLESERPEEERTKILIMEYLSKLNIQAGLFFEPEQPPDYRLTYPSGMTYALEVSRLIGISRLQTLTATRRQPLSMRRGNPYEDEAAVKRLLAKIRASAQSKNILRGEYLVTATATANITSLSTNFCEAIHGILRETLHEKSFELREITFAGMNTDWQIKKYESDIDDLSLGAYWAETDGWEGEIFEDLKEQLQQIISAKAKKMAGIPEPKILAIVDELLVARESSWVKALSSIEPPLLANFSSIVLITSEGNLLTLFGKGLENLETQGH